MLNRAAVRIRITILVPLAACTLTAGSARAQEGPLRGAVVDSAGKPIANADIGIVALRRLTKTDERGQFSFAGLPLGHVELSIRRLSYKPMKVLGVVSAAPGDSLLVKLQPSAAALEAVNVTASHERQREGIEDFYRRMVRGVGTFYTHDDILAHNTLRTSDVLRSAPGIRFVRSAGGTGIRFNSTAIVRRDCGPMIWLDGQRAPGLEIDDITATDIEGIELYSGPSTTPLQFSQAYSSSTCGTIVVWTRQPGS